MNNIQAMIYGSEQWNKHILFVEYLNAHPEKVSEYQHIKEQAIALYPEDVMAYSRHKSAFIEACIRDALHEWIR